MFESPHFVVMIRKSDNRVIGVDKPRVEDLNEFFEDIFKGTAAWLNDGKQHTEETMPLSSTAGFDVLSVLLQPVVREMKLSHNDSVLMQQMMIMAMDEMHRGKYYFFVDLLNGIVVLGFAVGRETFLTCFGAAKFQAEFDVARFLSAVRTLRAWLSAESNLTNTLASSDAAKQYFDLCFLRSQEMKSSA